jgi:hypothetical protein
MLHEDDVESDKVIVGKKVRLFGKLIEEKYNPLETMTVCLYANCIPKKGGESIYEYITNRTLINGIEIPAKSPEGMFEEISIPNDLDLVVKAIEEYYG